MRPAGCPKFSGEEAGGGGRLGPSITAPDPSMHALRFLPASSGTKPSSPPCSHRTKLTRGAREAEDLAPRDYHAGSPQHQCEKEAGSLGLALPALCSRSGLGCAPEPGNVPPAPALLYFDFFPRRKQLSRVYKRWEIGEGGCQLLTGLRRETKSREEEGREEKRSL